MEQIFGQKYSFKQMSPVFAEKPACNDIIRYRIENPGKDITFHDQFIKLVVSEGCSFECSYCSERLAFPEFHSFLEDDLVEICRRLVEETGYLKVILLADSLGEYGCDIGSSLPSLIRKLKTIDPYLTFALNNLNLHNFIQYFDEMSWFIENNYICHLNLPIQSASMRILKRMNRAYTRDDMDRAFSLLNRLNFRDFDTHIIVGFPGETEDDFNETINFILHYHPKYVLINKYMESSGAASASYSDVVSDKIAIARISKAEDCFNEAGIICNSEKGELIQNRLKILNS
jgi:threonylcarbamoyladenosine tRNA methylthiotransferase MtaB